MSDSLKRLATITAVLLAMNGIYAIVAPPAQAVPENCTPGCSCNRSEDCGPSCGCFPNPFCYPQSAGVCAN